MSPASHSGTSSHVGRSARPRGGATLRKAGRKGAATVTQEVVEEERTRLIQERHSEMQRVLDRHDDLVRESFHLDKFVSLLGYDPKEAKQDKSNVFLEYKARYDLLNTTASAGPSRATRRAQTERLEALNAPPSFSLSAPPRASRIKTTAKSSIGPPEKASEIARSLLADTKGKGKERAHADASQSISAAPSTPYKKGKMKAGATEHVAVTNHPIDPMHPSSISMSRLRKRPDMPPPPDPPPHKRRKTELRPLEPTESISDNVPVKRTPRRTRSSHVSADDLVGLNGVESTPLSSLSASPALSPIKRIKLIVRRPAPTVSHPLHRPDPPRFGDSVSAFLASYVTLDDREMDESALAALAKQDAAAWRDIDRLRAQGRLLCPPPDEDGGNAAGITGAIGGRRRKDVWDEILERVKARNGEPFAHGKDVTAQIAAIVKVYWEGQAARNDKKRAQEERQLRALAKLTIRMVTAEWKKAVFHIREQERLKREAEERRRGHEHLDAILDQSGQILEAQQVDLSRADISLSRSRSRSLSSTLQQHWESISAASEDEGSIQDSDDGNSSEGDESERSDAGGDGPDLSILLAESATASGVSNGTTNGHEYGDIQSSAFIDVDAISRATSPDSSAVPAPLTEKFSNKDDEDEAAKHDDAFYNRKSYASGTAIIPLHDRGSPYANGDTAHSLRKADHDGSSTGRSSPIHTPRYDDDEEEPVATDEPPQTPSEAYDTLPLESSHDVKKERHISFVDEPDIAFTDELSVNPFKSLHIHTTFDSTIPSQSSIPANGLSHDEKPEPPESSVPGEGTEGRDELEPIEEDEVEEDSAIPLYLRPYAVAPVEWDPQSKVKPPLLLRGTLRPYQQAGMEWLASLHSSNLNGILADEMGLGKTIQTIALLAHLACDRGIWGPHLIIVPTSVLLNWEMEFKKFLPGFKVLSYHGGTKRRKELRQGWNNKYHFNVCVTSYTLASRDAYVFKRKPWYYMILDEAHMIKNFKSQRWNILLMFRSFRRLLLTGTPLQNNLTELWALLQFLMSGTNFANLKEFAEWFANPLEKAIEMGNVLDEETQQRVTKLHTVLRPYLLRRLKRDVEKELPSKYEHLIMCPLSKRQRFLYDEFMARAETRTDLSSGVYQKIANILMQLRKVVNHPDLFEVRPIRTSFAMSRSAIADFEVKELLIRRELLRESDEEHVNFDLLGLHFVKQQPDSALTIDDTCQLDGTARLPLITELPGEPPPYDVRTIAGYRRYKAYSDHSVAMERWTHIRYINGLRCNRPSPVYAEETIRMVKQMHQPLLPSSALDRRVRYLDTVDRVHSAVKSYVARVEDMSGVLRAFAFVTPSVVARDLAHIALSGFEGPISELARDNAFDAPFHDISVKLQIAFPDPSLLQYDCGKLQQLDRLLKERKAGGHRILIFTQMTRILDILEIFLNFRGYLYLRLDGATKIEDRQYITERFNTDPRIFCFISSSRSGGVGINLTGADTVIFYDSDFNPQMDRQCEDRAHRIGQIRDVHIYRFVSTHTVEEALLRKANQKRSLDDIVIQKGEFDWRSLFGDESALTRALGEFEDTEDALAAEVAAREEIDLVGADEADFEAPEPATPTVTETVDEGEASIAVQAPVHNGNAIEIEGEEEEEDEGGTTVDYMLAFVQSDMDFFREWRI